MISFRPVLDERPLAVGQLGREIVEVIAINPAGFVCEESIFVNAATTLGVTLVDYAEIREEVPGGITRKLIWRLEKEAVLEAVPRYSVSELWKMWNDPAWLAQHPNHELAIAKAVSQNLLRHCERARTQPWLWRFAKSVGNRKTAVFIPCDASEEDRAKWLAELGKS